MCSAKPLARGWQGCAAAFIGREWNEAITGRPRGRWLRHLPLGRPRVVSDYAEQKFPAVSDCFVYLRYAESSYPPSISFYFLTFTVVGWVDIFIRARYVEVLYESLRYCQQHKGLVVHAFVVMSNHVHLVASTRGEPLSDIVRDFKKYTSRQTHLQLSGDFRESRREWMLNLFIFSGLHNPRNEEFQFWQQHSFPTPLWELEIIRQKIAYTHENPVRAGWVEFPEQYLHSSAVAYAGRKAAIEVEMIV